MLWHHTYTVIGIQSHCLATNYFYRKWLSGKYTCTIKFYKRFSQVSFQFLISNVICNRVVNISFSQQSQHCYKKKKGLLKFCNINYGCFNFFIWSIENLHHLHVLFMLLEWKLYLKNEKVFMNFNHTGT